MDKERRPFGIEGFVQAPRTFPWKPNIDGVIRNIDEVADIARRHGVEVPEEVDFQEVSKKYLPNTYGLHDEAWDVADRLVLAMRRKTGGDQ